MKNSHFRYFVVLFLVTIILGGCGSNISQKEPLVPQVVPAPKKDSQTAVIPPGKPVLESTGGDAYTMVEVAKHASQTDCWQVIDGKVYDVTNYISQHPAGVAQIVKGCGKDATKIFDLQHKPQTKNLLDKYFVGNLN